MRGPELPHQTVWPVLRTNPAPSTALEAPIRWIILQVLGGRDSASLDEGDPERENTVTECPQAARRPAAAAPAGPPPMMATSLGVAPTAPFSSHPGPA